MTGKIPKKDQRPEIDEYGRTALHYARDPEIIQNLIDSGLDVNLQDDNGWCPMHFFAQDGNVEAMEVALSNNANPNLTDSHGNGPLWTATMNAKGNFSCVIALLKAGAVANHRNAHGRSPSDMAATIKGGLESVFETHGLLNK